MAFEKRDVLAHTSKSPRGSLQIQLDVGFQIMLPGVRSPSLSSAFFCIISLLGRLSFSSGNGGHQQLIFNLYSSTRGRKWCASFPKAPENVPSSVFIGLAWGMCLPDSVTTAGEGELSLAYLRQELSPRVRRWTQLHCIRWTEIREGWVTTRKLGAVTKKGKQTA